MGGRWAGYRARGSGTMDVRVSVSPDPKEIARAFGSLGPEFKDWSPAFRRLIPIIAREVSAAFDSGGANLAGYFPKARLPWPNLTAAYAKYRAFRRGKRKRTRQQGMMSGPANRAAKLVLTGKLRAQATAGPGAVLMMTGGQMRYGVRLPYARAAQFGNPQRPFLGVTDTINDAALEFIADRIQFLMDQAIGRIGRSRAERLIGSDAMSRMAA